MENERTKKFAKVYRNCWDSYVRTGSKYLVALDVTEDDFEIVSFDLLMQLMRDHWQEDFNEMITAVYGSNGILETMFKKSEVKPCQLLLHNEQSCDRIMTILQYPLFGNVMSLDFVNQQIENVKRLHDVYEKRVEVLQQQEEDQGDVSHV